MSSLMLILALAMPAPVPRTSRTLNSELTVGDIRITLTARSVVRPNGKIAVSLTIINHGRRPVMIRLDDGEGRELSAGEARIVYRTFANVIQERQESITVYTMSFIGWKKSATGVITTLRKTR